MSLYATMHKYDHFDLYDGGTLNYQKAVRLLDFNRNAVAQAAGVSKNSVRYDKRIPAPLKERITQWANAINLVADHFEGNTAKTLLWFKTKNPALGNESPQRLIRSGLYDRLMHFILVSKESNEKQKT